MARKAVATSEAVSTAVEALVAEGLDPTVERVRAKLGGGSYTTINRLLADVLAQRQSQAAEASEVPADLIDIGQRAVASIYSAVQRQANAKIEALEADARKQIDAANHARAEAALEIERLEREGEQTAEALAAEQTATQVAVARAERAEATAQASKAEIDRLTRALAAAQGDIQSMRESEREAQQRAARSEDARRAAETENRKEFDRLQKALARAEAQVESSCAEVERLTSQLTAAQTEREKIEKDRGELEKRLSKAEASVEAAKAELQKARQELERTREGERRARDEAAELRGQFKVARVESNK